MRYLDPKNDLTFKKVFGEHPHLLRSFLNALLPLGPDQQIVSLEYLTPELVPQIPILKNSTVDVRCVDASGRHFLVEMQMLWTESFHSRVLFNASKAYVKQLATGEEYNLLQPVYSLNLVDDRFTPEAETEHYHHYQIVNIANTERQIKGLEFIFVELPNFRPKTMDEKKLRVLWLRYLTEIQDHSTEVPAEILADKNICEAVEYLRESAFTEGELDAYERYWDVVRVERTRIADSLAAGEKIGRAVGRAEGEQIGLEKGEMVGLAKGREEGIQESLARLVAGGLPEAEARKMLGISQ